MEENGCVYVKIVKDMYGLPQAGKIANDLLKKRLYTAGYYPVKFTKGLWRRVWRPITFTLVVDDFGIKFKGDQHANHLETSLERHYDITVDWEGTKYVGINLEWDYHKRQSKTVPNYVSEALHRVQHKTSDKQQHAPAKAIPIQYGAKV